MMSCKTDHEDMRYNELMTVLEDCLRYSDELYNLHRTTYPYSLPYSRMHVDIQKLILACLDKGTMYES